MIKWRIVWRTKDGDAEGHGQAILTKEQADAWVELENRQYPFILHWAEAVEVNDDETKCEVIEA